MRPLWWKLALILAVVGVSAWLVYPPDEKISLGTDLRGGAQILMEVDTESAIDYELNLTQTRLGQALKDRGLSYASIAKAGPARLRIAGTDPVRREDVRRAILDFVGDWDIRSSGAGVWDITMPGGVRQAVAASAFETTLTTLRTRVEGLGVRESATQEQGNGRILITLPGVDDPERIKDVLQDPAVLEWKAVSYPPGVTNFGEWIPPASREEVAALFGGTIPADTALYPQHFGAQQGSGPVSIWWPLKRVSVVVGPDLRSARRGQNQWWESTVDFTLTKDAGNRFQAATRENLGKKMAIVLGSAREEAKEVISAPRINDVIGDAGLIEGGFDVQGAEDLALKLRSGAIPADVRIIEERTVGPSLGRDSIRAGVTASVAGFALVMIAVLIYYRLSGLNAVIALALNVLLLLGAMVYLGASLTLPGIAGLILTVGMAVDSNVLIFERIREELRLGKTVRSSVDLGFRRAFLTILDCHVTTLVSAFFLFSYGTGPVQGFAVTLTIGLIVSMFTAVFVSRVIFEIVLGENRPVESLSI